MKRVTIERYASAFDSHTGERIGRGVGFTRVQTTAKAVFGHYWADVMRDVLGLALDREYAEWDRLSVKVVEVTDADESLCPRVVVLADGNDVESESTDTIELRCERRELKDDHVWISINTLDGPTVEAVVVLDPTFRERQPEYVAAVEAAYGITDARYWQLVALWCSTDHLNDRRLGFPNDVRDKLLKLAAN